MLLNYFTEHVATVILSFKDKLKMLTTACLCIEKRNRKTFKRSRQDSYE